MLIDQILNTIAYTVWSLTNIFTMVPPPKENATIIYTLYTPENPNPTIIENIEEIEIDSENDLKILCHGWTYSSYSTQWYNSTIEEYLKKGGISIITTNYTKAIVDVRVHSTIMYSNHIGSQIANFILKLNEKKGIKFDKVHILGHLIGAHIAGVAGEGVYKESGKYIDRITGMDPTNFGFLNYYTIGKLTRNAATFVDVIFSNYAAYQDTIGRIDFNVYPYMVRCNYNYWHRNQYNQYIAPVLYTKSINNNDTMVANRCIRSRFYSTLKKCADNVTATFGEYADRSKFGKFYLNRDDVYKAVCSKKVVETTTVPMTTTVSEVEVEE